MATMTTHPTYPAQTGPSVTPHQRLQSEDRGIKEILGDLYRNSKGVARQEIVIIKEETKSVSEKSKLHGILLVSFGALAVLSVFPLLAFLVIGLGRMMNDNYWASSLIVGLLFLIGGGAGAYSSLKKLKSDFQFPRSKATLRRLLDFFETETMKLKKDEVF
jgi:hypothetical protein